MRRLRLDDLAPFLLASYPTLSLLAHNAGEVPILVGLRPLLASLALAAILVLLFTAILRDRDKALLCTSLAVVMLLSYGHVYSGLKLAGLSGIGPGSPSLPAAGLFNRSGRRAGRGKPTPPNRGCGTSAGLDCRRGCWPAPDNSGYVHIAGSAIRDRAGPPRLHAFS